MIQIEDNKPAKDRQAKLQATLQNKNKKMADQNVVAEPDFVELHTLFEIQYEQWLNDTSDEIAKRTQRLTELQKIFS